MLLKFFPILISLWKNSFFNFKKVLKGVPIAWPCPYAVGRSTLCLGVRKRERRYPECFHCSADVTCSSQMQSTAQHFFFGTVTAKWCHCVGLNLEGPACAGPNRLTRAIYHSKQKRCYRRACPGMTHCTCLTHYWGIHCLREGDEVIVYVKLMSIRGRRVRVHRMPVGK
jgi:hypothetical protein